MHLLREVHDTFLHHPPLRSRTILQGNRIAPELASYRKIFREWLPDSFLRLSKGWVFTSCSGREIIATPKLNFAKYRNTAIQYLVLSLQFFALHSLIHALLHSSYILIDFTKCNPIPFILNSPPYAGCFDFLKFGVAMIFRLEPRPSDSDNTLRKDTISTYGTSSHYNSLLEN